jgi:hypothetical protein
MMHGHDGRPRQEKEVEVTKILEIERWRLRKAQEKDEIF